MIGLVVWAMMIAAGYQTGRIDRVGIAIVAIATAILFGLGLLSINDPVLTYEERQALLSPAVLAINLVIKLALVSLFFLIGVGAAKLFKRPPA